jgi:F420-0:gamma-glutamyl ligase-like protein
MNKYYVLPIVTEYWKPGTDYIANIASALEKRLVDGDFVVVSEKALSTALGYVLDEGVIQSSFNAKFISRFWMQIVWGNLLGVICRLGKRLQRRLREYPFEAGSRHKQVVLQQAGPLQALMWGSEGGIDGSNLPYSYVSLPLCNPYDLANEIRNQLWMKLKKKVFVIIVDTDKTYSFRNFHFTPHPKPMKGIHSLGGVISYVIGRMFKLRKRPTPLAVASDRLQTIEVLKIGNIADRARGPGSGATVWDMAAKLKVAITKVSWEMLSTTQHKPVVIVRRKGNKPSKVP